MTDTVSGPLIALYPDGIVEQSYSLTTATGIVLQATTHQWGFKFYTGEAITVDAVDLRVRQIQTPVGVNLTLEIQTDSSDAPSGTLVGTATTPTAAPTPGNGNEAWTSSVGGIWTLGSAASLSANTPYWMVVKVSSATTLDATNFYQAKHLGTGTAGSSNRQHIRQHNGTNWTTTAEISATGVFVVRTSAPDVSYRAGLPITASAAISAQSKIGVSSAKQGLKTRFGASVTLIGAKMELTKTGSTQGTLTVTVYEGATSKYSGTAAVGEVTSSVQMIVWFTSPVALTAGADIYIVLSTGAGDASNNYTLQTYAINSTYIGALLSPNTRMVAGTGTDPTAFSVITTEVPCLAPIIVDPAADMTAGGTTTVRLQTWMD